MAQVDVQNRISNITSKLPAAVMQQGLKVSKSNSNFLMVVALSSTGGSMDQFALADYITRNIQNSVSRVPGVGSFQLFAAPRAMRIRSEEHTSELQSLMRISYAVFCLKKKK